MKLRRWRDLSEAWPWMAAIACFFNAFYANDRGLMATLLLCALVLGLAKLLGRKVWSILLLLLLVLGLSAAVLEQAMLKAGFSLAVPWLPNSWFPGLQMLQQSGIGHWPVLLELGERLYRLLSFCLGNSEINNMGTGVTLIGATLGLLIYMGIRDAGTRRLSLLAVVLPLYYAFRYDMDVADSLSMFFVYGAVVFRQNQETSSRERISSEGPFFAPWTMLMAMLLVFLALILHAAVPFNTVSDQVQNWMPDYFRGGTENNGQTGHQPFKLAETAYYPLKTRLGGPVGELGSGIVFRIQAPEAPLYLRGAVYDAYDGQRWSVSSTAAGQKGWNSAYDGSGRPVKSLGGGISLNRMDVEEVDFHSDVIFSPLGFWKTSSTLRVETLPGATYKQVPKWLQKPVRKYSVLYTGNDMHLGDRKASLELPAKSASALKDLAAKITKGATGDAEKLAFIQAYLKSTCTYALDVPVPPEEEDFVLYFTTHSKRGYCTYFGTAAAVLARASGIPSRYVEGYLVSPLRSVKGTYYVTEDLAHAWSEAYLPGKGWVSLETTPAYDFTGERAGDLLTSEPRLSNEAKNKDLLQKPNEQQGKEKDHRWMAGLFGVMVTGGLLFAGLMMVFERMVLRDRSRQGYLKKLYLIESLLEQKFESQWTGLGVHQKLSRYFLMETNGTLLAFDDIMETAEIVLYGSTLPGHGQLVRLDEFTECFIKHYTSRLTRIMMMLSFLKGWTITWNKSEKYNPIVLKRR